ncbi:MULTISPECIES: hypothetical protein [unclassified Aureimonas]|uniref:hypothetical protein n=1 Tax=unclassified Aureimonas TaxID=2615206 RepID=UPI0006F6715D|nr:MULTISPECIES: hypothetical protein [unclassified Aureimonas]KQT57498.1 hypothetical protein ASG62_09295 [Aureimonas sp. Leaf427]KQT77178.1 hypothetical protein ASG54_13165 [Aureimonas sp. Leaf460]
MLAEAEKDRIANEIGNLFEGLSLDDVAQILTIQLAMLAAQGADNQEEALEFLDEMRDDAAEVLQSIDFEATDEDEDEEEAKAPAS